MELLQLKYFCNAAETENFSQTAKKFLVPPSDISQSIKRLETELAMPLFNRTANSICLNEKGKAFYLRVKSALAEIDAGVYELVDSGIQGQLKICIKCNRRIVMQTAEKFQKLYPAVDIIVRHSGEPETDDFDILITAEDLSHKGFIVKEILLEDVVLAVRNDSPLAKKENLTSADLELLPFITMNSGANLHTVTQKVCSEFGFTPRIAIQSDDPFYIRRCVELGLGVAIVPSLSWKGQYSQNVVFKKLKSASRTTYVCHQKDKYLSHATEKFIEMLIEECENELK